MAEPRWLDDTEARAWRGLLRMHTVVTADLARDLDRDAGLSWADYDVLVALSEAGDQRLRAHELCAQLGWEKSRLSHHVKRMEQRRLVQREECESDARGQFVGLTPAGHNAITQAAPAHVANVRRRFLDRLSRRQIEMLARIAEEVVPAGE